MSIEPNILRKVPCFFSTKLFTIYQNCLDDNGFFTTLKIRVMTSQLNTILSSTYSNLLAVEEADSTQIILVRHGQTEWNLSHIYQGQGDSALTAVGISGAIKVGKKLHQIHQKERKIDFVYCSPLGRAKHTLKLIMEQFKNPNDAFTIRFDDRLMERNFGDFQGKSKIEIKRDYAEVYNGLMTNPEYRPPGQSGEAFAAVTKRSVGFLAEIAAKHHGKRVLVISHGGVISAIFTDLLLVGSIHGYRPSVRRFYCKNCAINMIERDHESGKWFLSVLGDDNYGDFQSDNNRFSVNKHSPFRDLSTMFLGFAMGVFAGYTALKWQRRSSD
eukprot:279997_1